ncbi:hypothetical protein KAR91_68490 [Candidatus Pacearchaeota archaeon]|nr:hypothetical protein [Candidatus Pacearchaeota archaeon]
MEITVIAYCPECSKQNLVGLVQTGMLNEISFYDDDPDNAKMFAVMRHTPSNPSIVTICDCGKRFVVDVELEAHIITHKIVEEQ